MPHFIIGKPLGPIGYGMISLIKPPQLPQHEAISLLKAAIDAGANFIDAGVWLMSDPTTVNLM